MPEDADGNEVVIAKRVYRGSQFTMTKIILVVVAFVLVLGAVTFAAIKVAYQPVGAQHADASRTAEPPLR
jgi:hypothetical protein